MRSEEQVYYLYEILATSFLSVAVYASMQVAGSVRNRQRSAVSYL